MISFFLCPPWEGTPRALGVHGEVSVLQWAAMWIHPEPPPCLASQAVTEVPCVGGRAPAVGPACAPRVGKAGSEGVFTDSQEVQ